MDAREGLRFSIIIPTLDEESTIALTLRRARTSFGEAAELIVVDGGSHDRTRSIAADAACVLVSARGRGAQLRTGSEAARGDLVVFLHADTHLGPDAGPRVEAAFRDVGVVGGCCRFAVDPPAEPFSRFALLEWGINWRTRLLGTATGDQAIVARRESLERIGGVPPLPLFEDVELVRRLRRLGRFARLDVTANTSRRRWEEHGFWLTVLQHWALRAGFRLGISPGRLAGWYERRRAAGSGRRRPTAGPV
jgi:rSAM/selenodomain-associated transferase 2